jgi:hypothetical protein
MVERNVMVGYLRICIFVLGAAVVAPQISIAQTGQSGFDPWPSDTSNGPYGYADDYDPPPEISPNAERWRYSFHNGHWWYFTPQRKWLYWSQGRWVDYLPPGRSNTPPYIQPPVPQRSTVRRRLFNGPYNAYRYNAAPAPFGGGGFYYGQTGFGAY